MKLSLPTTKTQLNELENIFFPVEPLDENDSADVLTTEQWDSEDKTQLICDWTTDS